jgi:hypothetical protein
MNTALAEMNLWISLIDLAKARNEIVYLFLRLKTGAIDENQLQYMACILHLLHVEQVEFGLRPLHLQPSTFNLQPIPFNHQPSTFNLKPFRVERFVASPLPHRSVPAAFPHTVPLFTVSLIHSCDRFSVLTTVSIL